MRPDEALPWAGAVALAFIFLMGYAITLLRNHPRLAAVIAALATLAGALPAVLLALGSIH
jgi:ABC-type Fe3+ transport system permease subunit